MNQLASTFKPTTQARPAAINPLARAMAETEQSLGRGGMQHADSVSDFSNALAKTGGNFDFGMDNQANPDSQNKFLEQQQQQEADARYQQERQRLHNQINPVESEVYSKQLAETQKMIENVRDELKGMIEDAKHVDVQVELTLQTQLVDPGLHAKYYLAFFSQLRSFIILLRQKIRSAGTWATTLHGKNSKKARKSGPGMEISGKSYEKTSTIQTMMQNERNSSYGAG